MNEIKITPGNDSEWYAQNGDNTYWINHNLNQDSIVLDIGASIGNWTHRIFNQYNSYIYAFEPTENINNIINHDKIKKIKSAAYNKDGTELFGINNHEPSALKNDNQIKVNVTDINKFILSFNVIDLIKINIEGGEYDLLQYILNDHEISKRIKSFLIQFHLIENIDVKSKYDNIINLLINNHFKLDWRFDFVWEKWSK